jgi:uncharacterized membrane protein YphA (DoxX/SURF4 family)
MNIFTLALYIGIAALAFSFVVIKVWKKHNNMLMTFLQNFAGFLFIFSGWVKAVDPLGTAYKLEQYFAEFEYTFEPTWFSFIAPLFPFFSNYALTLSIITIIFEIVLGIMLVIGAKPKFTSWAFFLLVLFFTFLTGFTYLTGYVPSGENFFSFGSWQEYDARNMRVTDCGCFGDFIKLEPKVSFFKDVVLLFPALFFIFKFRDMHQLMTEKMRNIAVGASTALLLLYCINNFHFNLPHIDFRDFNNGANVAAIKEAEDEAAANVQITHWEMLNKSTGEITILENAYYMKNYLDYPKEEWEVLEQIMSKPAIPRSKISDFSIEDADGNDVNYVYLDNDQYHFMIVSHKAKYTTMTAEVMVKDSIYAVDTVFIDGMDDYQLLKRLDRVEDKTETLVTFNWNKTYLNDFRNNLKPFIDAALADGHEVSVVFGALSRPMVESFKKTMELDVECYTADDILLKTIIRSNPGIVLWKDGSIIRKWHKKRLPNFDQVKKQWLRN